MSFLQKYQESVLNDSISILECDKLLGDNQKKYSMMLDEALDQLRNTKVDTEHLSDFFNKTYNSLNIDEAPLTIPVRKLTDVEKIRPQYLSQMVNDVISVCSKITNNEITSAVELDSYINNEYVLRYKRQLVKTNIPSNFGDRIDVLLNYGKPILCEVNTEFFQTTCMPFLRSYSYNVKELGDTNNNIRTIVSKCYDNIKTYLKTVDTLRKSNKLTELQYSLLRQFLFNATNRFLELTSYVVFMAIRRINDFSFNLNSFMYLYNEITRYYPEGDAILHESVLDGSFEEIDDADMVFDLVRNNNSTLKIIADRILQKVKSNLSVRYGNATGDLFHSVIDVNSESKDYDISVYDNINDMFIKISQDLNTLKANMSDEFILVDDLMNKSNFDNKLTHRFQSIITSINNTECYTDVLAGDNDFTDSDVALTIINELNHFDENIDVITRNIHETYDELKEFSERLESNINAEFSNNATRLEVIEKMKDIEIDYSDLVLLVSKQVLERLHSLSDICNQIEFKADEIHDHDGPDLDFENMENYAEMARDFELEMLDLEYKYMVEQTTEMFNNKLLEKKYGITIYEAEQPTTQGNKESNSDSPEVENTNSKQEEAAEVTNTEDGNNQQNKLKSGTFVKDLMTKVQTFFDSMVSKFKAMIKKQLESNKAWLDKNAEAILGRKNWNPISIKMNKHYYMDFMGLFNTCHSTLKNNLNALTPEKINSFKSPDDLDKFIFSFIENPKNGIKEELVSKLTYNGNSTDPVTFTGNGAKQLVTDMINYCNNYYNQDANNVSTTIDTFSNEIVNKIKSMTDIEQSTIRHIVSLCQYYAGTVLNVQRDRTYAYLKALKKLVPRVSNVQQEEPTEGEGTEGNSEENQ